LNRDAFRRGLKRLEEYIDRLDEIATLDQARFLSDFMVHAAAERFLQLAIESILDLGNQIIAARELSEPTSYREIPLVLGRAGILPTDFAESLVPMVKFRNVLVHDYADLDLNLVHEIVVNRRQNLRQCLGYLSRYYAHDTTQPS